MYEIDMTAANKLPTRGEELFRIFSRFEYALKEIGYAAPGKRNDEVEVSWDQFVTDRLGHGFFQRVIDEEIAPTISSNPPKRQVVDGQTLEWRHTAPPKSAQDLFGAVRRVRNNLFHGGKAGDPDADRNTELVSEAISVLMEALKAGGDIRDPFEGRW